MSHTQYMKIALNLAKQGLGRTWPNPTVGCVIVKDGIIISRARTANGGRPHAESRALKNLEAEGAIAYVTLEPCAHDGSTPSCAGLLLGYGIKKVVVATRDPDPRTSGKGIEMLKNSGIEVIEGIGEKEAKLINRGFLSRIENNRPFIALKAATTHDNRYAAGKGKPTWVTNELSRQYVHVLRSKFDCIVTGTATVLADNPNLDVRINGLEDTSPMKIILGKTEIPSEYNIFKGKEVVTLDKDLPTCMNILASMGLTRAMIEAGPRLSNALLKENLVDEVYWFKGSNEPKEGIQYFEDGVLDSFKELKKRDFDGDELIRLSPK